MAKKKNVAKNGNGDLEFADRLWAAANRLRGTVEAAEYKHIILGLLFLKYLSDAFENRHKFLLRAVNDPANTEYYVKEAPAEYIASVAEDKDEYLAANVFWIPPRARWSYLLANAHQPNLGRLIDEAMAAIELLGDTFTNDLHPDLRADFVITNPPFNMKEWGADKVAGDIRLKFGQPPNTNANYMWIQHFIHHLAPNGRAGFVMANGSLSVGGTEGEIRKKDFWEEKGGDCRITAAVDALL
ncbi:HsdM-like protein [Thermodesulfitimonas autotrophica]|uniref:site-specific DNA-methyltransferase (adenine-specific) n=1 Tax=Thermodesulfitimonas autotrophica TaxID=1894989 RepID=A0A3N5AWJ6_9THEO|nr:N-6 DNA methylase [Thermodesulfitimonas autotrophica]RPF49389.1 HsdM-like protein [Thermodesulfitimonas autotrophica]